MAKKELGYAVLGVGVGRHHAAGAAKANGAKLIAICDLRDDRIAAQKELYPDILYYKDFDEMLKNPDIDIVSIATPSGMHAEHACKAMRAGKNILVEKPIDVTIEKAEMIEKVRKETGVKVGCVFQNRRIPTMQAMKDAIDAGRLGKIFAGMFRVIWYRTDEYFVDGGWRGTWKWDGGGSLMNQAVHTVDLMQWMMGDVLSVQSAMNLVNHNIETEDLTQSIVKFKSGAIATFTSSTCAYPGLSTDVCVNGTDGTIHLDAGKVKVWKIKNETKELMDEEEEKMKAFDGVKKTEAANDPTKITGHAFHVQDIIDAVRYDRDPFVGPAEAIKAVKIILAIYESAKNGGKEVFIK